MSVPCIDKYVLLLCASIVGAQAHMIIYVWTYIHTLVLVVVVVHVTLIF